MDSVNVLSEIEGEIERMLGMTYETQDMYENEQYFKERIEVLEEILNMVRMK